MTGPIASSTVSIPLPGATALPSFFSLGASAGAAAAVPGISPSLATFVDMMIGKVVAPRPKPVDGGRQPDAAPGKALPDEDGDDPIKAFAWLFAPVAVEPPAMVTPQVAPLPTDPVAVSLDDVAIAVTPPPGMVAPSGPDPVIVGPEMPAPVVATDLTASLPPAAPAPTPPALKGGTGFDVPMPVVGIQVPVTPDLEPLAIAPAPLPASVAAKPGAVVPPVTEPVIGPVAEPIIGPIAEPIAQPVSLPPAAPTDPDIATELRVRSTAVATSRPVVAAPAPTAPAPIAQPVAQIAPMLAQIIAGGAAQPALFALAAGRERSTDDKAQPALAATAAASLLLQPTDAAALIAKPGGAQGQQLGQALDMGRQDWPQKMIDRIETLRDNADATDTSIRLKPDALGGIQVAVRSHGDGAVSVRFTADHPTTRTLLADAQPQLQAAAEARGIKLTGTSVDLSNSGGQPERGQPRFGAKANTINHLAASGENDAVTDGRVA